MKKVKVELEIFEKGDRVLTPEGEGTIMKDEELDRTNLYNRTVDIKLDEPTSHNTNGVLKEYDAWMCLIINEIL
jgi:hypothetical protein